MNLEAIGQIFGLCSDQMIGQERLTWLWSLIKIFRLGLLNSNSGGSVCFLVLFFKKIFLFILFWCGIWFLEISERGLQKVFFFRFIKLDLFKRDEEKLHRNFTFYSRIRKLLKHIKTKQSNKKGITANYFLFIEALVTEFLENIWLRYQWF